MCDCWLILIIKELRNRNKNIRIYIDEGLLTLLVPVGVGFFRTPSNFTAFGDTFKVRYIEMFHADFSNLSTYKNYLIKKIDFFLGGGGGVPPLLHLK